MLLSLGMTGVSTAGATQLHSSEPPAESAAVTVHPASAEAHAVLRAATCQPGALDRDTGRWWVPTVLAETGHHEPLGWWQSRTRPACTPGESPVARTCQERAPPRAGPAS